MLYAQKLALKQNVPLHVCFCLVPKFLGATYRHFYFMLEGLKEVEKELREYKQVDIHTDNYLQYDEEVCKNILLTTAGSVMLYYLYQEYLYE